MTSSVPQPWGQPQPPDGGGQGGPEPVSEQAAGSGPADLTYGQVVGGYQGPEPPPCPHGHLEPPPGGDPLVARYGLGAAALRYASLGLPVLKLKEGTKRPDTEHGFKDATTSREVITSPDWWGGNPVLNLGIDTEGLLLIDLDRKNGADGAASLRSWLAENGLTLPEVVPWEDTPSYGAHLWLRLNGRQVQSRAGVLPGVDIRSSGGYVAAWPSGIRMRHTDPREPPRRARPEDYHYGTYHWHGCPCQAPEAPADLLDALEQLRGSSSGGGGGGGGGGSWNGLAELPPTEVLAERGVDTPQDVNLARLAARLCREHMTWEQAYPVLRRVADISARTDPWLDLDLRRKFDSAGAKGFDQPAQLPEGAMEAMSQPEPPQPPAAAMVPAAVQGVVVPRPDVIDRRGGLLADKAASWVMGQGPLRYGIDNQLWAYDHGVWLPGEDPAADIVHARITSLLGNKYRQGHGTNIKDMIRAQVGVLHCDPVPELINFRNGLLSWREGELRPHSPDVLSTVQLTVNWNPAAVCPEFDKFLASALVPGAPGAPGSPPAPGDVDRMWETIGYLLLSGNPLHKIFLLLGRGFNGKGVLLRVLTALLGQASVSSVSLHSLAEERFTRVNLLGKLANICGDLDATYIERTGLVKQLTGEDLITAEHKFRKPTQFTCWAVPLFSANEMPTSSDTSLGWRRRWEVFTFPNVFPDNPALEPALQQPGELEGIAAHAVRSLRQLMGRNPPEFTRTAAGDAAKADFAIHQDPLAGWLYEETWTQQGAWADRRTAYASFKAWRESSGSKYPLTKQKFYGLMRERFSETKRGGWDGYEGLLLRALGGGILQYPEGGLHG
jgi:putative DNA primase/helicase